MEIKFTDAQQEVLNDSSDNLLVSASAGSGKTATLIEKIVELVINKGIDITSLLVITFTEAASSEMKLRLKDKLYEAVKTNPKLRSQIEKLPLCSISTIHSFCAKEIRKNFFKLGLNPNFFVLDESNSKYLKALAINKVIKKYSGEYDEEFIKLVSLFDGGRNFSSFKEAVLNYYEFLCSIEDKQKFITESLVSCYDGSLSKNKACKELNNYLIANFYYFNSNLKTFLTQAQIEKATYFEDFISSILNFTKEVKQKNSFIKNREVISNFDLPKLTTKKLEFEDENFKDGFKVFYDQMLKQFNELKKGFCCGESEDELINNLTETKTLILKFQQVEDEFEKEYLELKDRRNALDFADLEKFFLKLLEDDITRSGISKNFSYIFVDEYQDINEVQELILNKITSENHIVMVGDIKQSIYGFRNSSPSIFVNKSIKYSQSGNSKDTLINLNENFRSNPEILNFVNAIFSKIMSREFGGVDYFKDGMLIGKAKYKKVDNINPTIKLCVVDKDEKIEINESFEKVYSAINDKNLYLKTLTQERMQAMVIAENIAKLIGTEIYDAKKEVVKKVTYGDIAILGRGNDFLKQISKVLLEYKIPISSTIAEDIYRDKDVDILLSLLKLINNYHDDISLSVVLTSFFGKFTFDELCQIRNMFSNEVFFYTCFEKFANICLDEEKNINNENISENKKIEQQIELTEETINLVKKAKSIFEFLQDCRFKLQTSMSVYDLLLDLEKQFDYFNYFKMLPGGSDRYLMVKRFIDSFEGTEYNYDISKFLSFVKDYAQDSKLSTSTNSSPNSVKIGTIHSSKGLEFPIVFLVGVNKPFSSMTFRSEILKHKELGLGMSSFNLIEHEKKENLAKNCIHINLKKQEKAEELRLLYVALTRAKNHLIVVGQSNLKTAVRANNFKEAEAVNSFMPWVYSGLSDVGFKCLIENKKDLIDKHKDFNVEVKVYKESDFIVENNLSSKIIDFDKFEDSENALKVCHEYKFENKNNIALKNSVSSVLREVEIEYSNFVDAPKKLEINESDSHEEVKLNLLGSAYHKIMQELDFEVKEISKEYLTSFIAKLDIDESLKSNICVEDVLTCFNTIKSLNISWHKKELPFISYLPYNAIFKNSSITDKILIQGVADLIVKSGNDYILIDYKTGKSKNADYLVGKYKTQLDIYKLCIEKALNINISNCYIYSFTLKKLIKTI